jgi:hypothetical protein
MPSVVLASLFVPIDPPTQIDPFQATELHLLENIEFPFADAVHVIPSEEYARLLVPCPPATQIDPFQATE